MLSNPEDRFQQKPASNSIKFQHFPNPSQPSESDESDSSSSSSSEFIPRDLSEIDENESLSSISSSNSSLSSIGSAAERGGDAEGAQVMSIDIELSPEEARKLTRSQSESEQSPASSRSTMHENRNGASAQQETPTQEPKMQADSVRESKSPSRQYMKDSWARYKKFKSYNAHQKVDQLLRLVIKMQEKPVENRDLKKLIDRGYFGYTQKAHRHETLKKAYDDIIELRKEDIAAAESPLVAELLKIKLGV